MPDHHNRFDRRPKPGFRRPSGPPAAIDDGIVRLFGIHPIEAALRNPGRRIGRVLMTDNAARRLGEALAERGITPEPVTPRELDRMLGPDTVHQGAMLETEPLVEPELADLAEAAHAGAPVVILDQVTDPHNAGAVIRSAAVFGAAGLVMTRRHSPPLNGTLAKSASGALEVVPIVLSQNLARAMAELKEQGVRIIGLDGDGETLIDDEPLTGPTAFVLGAEGKGLRQLTRDTCDSICRIGAPGPIDSLNVSNAAAVALHLAAMRRRTAATG
ncbi:MAG: 23S rRNA (guanosine(2251)-2'-O)-methyltransferase RlmB [Hyphomicrobium sp.]